MITINTSCTTSMRRQSRRRHERDGDGGMSFDGSDVHDEDEDEKEVGKGHSSYLHALLLHGTMYWKMSLSRISHVRKSKLGRRRSPAFLKVKPRARVIKGYGMFIGQ